MKRFDDLIRINQKYFITNFKVEEEYRAILKICLE
jgi:hypothetical protein